MGVGRQRAPTVSATQSQPNAAATAWLGHSAPSIAASGAKLSDPGGSMRPVSDRHEREADKLADRITRAAEPRPGSNAATSTSRNAVELAAMTPPDLAQTGADLESRAATGAFRGAGQPLQQGILDYFE